MKHTVNCDWAGSSWTAPSHFNRRCRASSVDNRLLLFYFYRPLEYWRTQEKFYYHFKMITTAATKSHLNRLLPTIGLGSLLISFINGFLVSECPPSFINGFDYFWATAVYSLNPVHLFQARSEDPSISKANTEEFRPGQIESRLYICSITTICMHYCMLITSIYDIKYIDDFWHRIHKNTQQKQWHQEWQLHYYKPQFQPITSNL